MPFPYSFPFTFDIKRMLKLFLKKFKGLIIKSTLQEYGLTIHDKTQSGLTIDSNIGGGLSFFIRKQANHKIMCTFKGGG